VASWILGFLERGGYFALALLTFVESVFPPIPSELILPLAGYLARQDKLSLWGVIAAAGLGAVLGALSIYYMGRRLGRDGLRDWAERRGRWVAVSPDEIDRAHDWFERHGGSAVLLGRLVPGVRSLISLPAGTSGMGLPRFLLHTAIGSLAWSAILAAAGYALGAGYEMVDKVLDPITWVVLGIVLVLYVRRVIRGTGGGKGREGKGRRTANADSH
jgi:membrane protein DedA with SNARE-associated domain